MATSTTDHDEIRRWAESKGGKPAAVARTHQGGDTGIVRIMFPDNKQSEHGNLVEIGWDEFFNQFEESNLALVYDANSLFSKIIGRDTMEKREHGEHASCHHPAHAQASTDEPRQERSGSDGGDLKSREYTDASGNIHHHTRAYAETHRKG